MVVYPMAADNDFIPKNRVAQCISLQLHHPVNRGEVGAERGTPGLQAEEPADADPTAYEVFRASMISSGVPPAF